MISKTVVKEYLKTELDDWTWLKEVSEEELKEGVKENKFKLQPFKHQMASFLAGMFNPHFLFLLDMGLGKTSIVLNLIQWRMRRGHIKKTLIVVPNVTTISGWAAEIKKHTDLTYTELWGTKEERLEKLKTSNTDLYIINYMGLQVLLAEGRNGKRMLKRPEEFDKYKEFDCIVFDELQFCKSFTSLSYLICKELSMRIKYRYGMTGTPFGRDPQDLWSQFFLIDHGETFGRNITFFRQAFFNSSVNYWGGYEWKLKKELEPVLHKKMQNKSIRYAESEAQELPPKIYITVPITYLSGQTYDFYKKTVQEMMYAKGNVAKLEGCFSRLRQITSGFVQFRDEDTKEKEIIDFSENPKLDALMEIIEGTGDKKVVVFNEFIHSGDTICKRLTQENIPFRRLYGGTLNKTTIVEEFVNNDKYKVFVVNSQSGAVALNLQIAKYVIFYESPVSVITRAQAEKRCHRTGQDERVFIYDLVVKNSIDEKLIRYLKEGKDLFKALVEGVVEL